jgi:hypothetical protein
VGRHQNAAALGMLWSIQGTWRHANGASLQAGDAITPGELLQPDATDHRHSVIVLLPDGQRLHYECFDQSNCARGFRVPALSETPTAFEVSMLDRMRTTFTQSWMKTGSFKPTSTRTLPPAAKDEAMVVLGADNQVRLTGLAASLPRGHYTYDLVRHVRLENEESDTVQHHLAFEKKDGPAAIPLPAAGLYEMRIADEIDRPRINLFLAATTAQDAQRFASFAQAKKTLEEWNEDNAGWPLHDLLRLYLFSLAQSTTAK